MRDWLIRSLIVMGAIFLVGCQSAPSKSLAKATGESMAHIEGGTVDVIHAEILSLNVPDQKMSIKDTVTGNKLDIRVADRSTLPSFKVGDRVRITFTNAGRDVATNVVAEEI